MKTEFFLSKDKAGRVSLWIQNESGFVGKASEQDKASLPILYAKFQNALLAYGDEAATKVAEEKGEWRAPKAPRPTKVVERELERVFAHVRDLQDELAKAISLEQRDNPVDKVKKAVKKVVSKKKKTSSKKTEAKK